ncbi:MAG: TonB-dependent receptor [Novosphingobium sp. 17-62-19]|uniref:TonB-dependent receptor n=1 Tax=Novosphingobium sp. 17-62-19 TaxID=1970406 RepID=UPI000BCEEAFD|nr:TonB-dependent receptor [Novosphingobium sp. 17-62-19]OZA20279.1 MAG: TonB-dependent receptor [Novosphingobium sp. 17-62-19]HQS96848.1 TonB-dependent receptor [Novosphingobium sp.]
MRMASISIAAMAAAIAVPAFAQDNAQAEESTGGIAQIVVTAQKRAENVQDVPIAISAFSADALQERAVGSVASLSNISPNVTLDAGTPFSGSSAVLSAYIRGIGANDFAFNIDPGVGVYLDGVYLARSVGANQDLPDVERIEVLKGPQGTLFGRNTIGGAISIVTHDPGDEFRFKGDVTTGRFGLLQTRGTVDLPLTDGLAASVSFSTKNRDGYVKRVAFPGAENFDSTPITNYKAAGYNNIGYGTEGGDNSWNLRGKLRYDNKTNLRITLSGDYSNIDQSQLANTLISTTSAVFAGTYNCAIEGIVADSCGGGPPSFAYIGGIGGLNSIFDNPTVFGVNVDADPNNNRLPYDNRFVSGDVDVSYANGNNYSKMKSYGGSGTIEFDLSDTVMIKSITAYRELHWNAGMDLDSSPLNFLHTSFTMNQYQFSQEVQLNGSAMDKTLNYVLGAYFFKEAGDLHDYVTFAEGLLQVDGPNDLSTKNYAFFGQIDYRPTEQFGITIGGRYTKENKTFEGFQSDANGLTYKILNQVGVPECASINPISDACRIAAGFPNQGEPLRYYIAGTQRKSFSDFSPKIGLQYHPTDDVMLYGSWSKGYKTGGWTTRLSNPLPTAPDFDEEKATTWEVGVKSMFLDNRLQINAAAFHTDYKGIQLNFQQGVSPTIQNAGDARIKGFEVEVVAAPTDGFLINASVGYTDATYTAVLAGAQVAANPFQAGVFPGADLPKTPKWKFNVSPRYELSVGGDAKVVILGDWTHTTSLWNDTERAFLLQRGPTDIVNGNISYKSGNHWDLTVGVTNITDERYLVTGQAQITGGQFYGTYSRPREWFARLGVEF